MAQSITKRITDRLDIIRGRRSSRWPKVRAAYIEDNPSCAVCGKRRRIQVHHIKDFSTSPELELDADNLMTLCMGTFKCHLLFGHLGHFQSINPGVLYDTIKWSGKIANRRGR